MHKGQKLRQKAKELIIREEEIIFIFKRLGGEKVWFLGPYINHYKDDNNKAEE
jgi:hypothetical protein